MSMTLQGTLGEFRLAEVLTFLNTTRRSGRLELECGLSRCAIFLSEGEVVCADSEDPQLTLSALALRKSGLTKEQRGRLVLLAAVDADEFSRVALEQGLVDAQSLIDLRKRRIAEIVYDCFPWSSGTFSFVSGAALWTDSVTIDVALCNLIMEGARRIDAWQECRKLFPNEYVILVAVRNPQVQGAISLSKPEWNLLLRLDGKLTLNDLATEEGADPLTVYRTLYGMLANQLVEVVPPEQVSTRIVDNSDMIETVARRQTVASDLSLVLSPDATITYEDVLSRRVSMLRDVGTGTNVTLIDEEYRIGRRTDAEICLPDELVSSVHAVMRRDGDGYRLEDASSKNGTFVNGERIQIRELRHGDSIRIGSTEFRFSTEASLRGASGNP